MLYKWTRKDYTDMVTYLKQGRLPKYTETRLKRFKERSKELKLKKNKLFFQGKLYYSTR